MRGQEATSYPLLIQGILLTRCSAVRVIATSTGTFQKGRGNIKWLDLMPEESDSHTITGNTFSLNGGSIGILVSQTVMLFRFNVAPFQHRFIPVNIDSGQSYSVTLDSSTNNASDSDFGARLHVYYDNVYDTPEFRAKLDADSLTLQRQSYRYNLVSGSRSEAKTTVPADQGDVCAFCFTYEGAFIAELFDVSWSMQVNGVAVVIDACAYTAVVSCTRRMLIFPIHIEREAEITIILNDEAGTSQSGFWTLTLFFDDDKLSR